MSGGGAGKVYFVLYLAVVLELLIIIVERDEAEEHLHSKQKEAMKMVESILSQLQSGSGTEGINTRPKDEITMRRDGMTVNDMKEALGAEIKSYRNYVIEVGVTDVSSKLQRDKEKSEEDKKYFERLEKLVALANVQDIEFQIFFNKATNQKDVPTETPEFFTDTQLKENKIDIDNLTPGEILPPTDNDVSWEYIGVQKLELDTAATFKKLKEQITKWEDKNKDKNKSPFEVRIEPIYKKPETTGELEKFVPEDVKENRIDSLFYYIKEESDTKINDEFIKKSFAVNFQPAKGQGGWYKLRFLSRTNRILGIKGAPEIKSLDEVKDDMTVNIGTVQLKAKELKKVIKNIEVDISEFGIPASNSLMTTKEMTDAQKREVSEKFDKQLQTAKNKAKEKGEKYEEYKGKIELYGYITRLLTPNSSRYFDQNSNSIEFDVRVIIPEPQSAPGTIILTDVNYFDALPPAFKLGLKPYQGGETLSKLVISAKSPSGKVYTISDFDIELEQSYKSKTLKKGDPLIEYVVKFKDKLPKVDSDNNVRIYDLSVEYKTGSGEKGTTKKDVKLNLFKTVGKTPDLEEYFRVGETFNTDYFPEQFEPTSGGKISENQFRTFIQLDGSQKIDSVDGLKTSKQNWLLGAENKSYDYWVSWVDNVTNKQIEVFPRKNYKLVLGKPQIILEGMVEQPAFQIGGNTFLGRVSGIKVTPPMYLDNRYKYKLSVDESVESSSDELTVINVTPTLDDEGNLDIQFTVTGTPKRGTLSGKVNLIVTIIGSQESHSVSEKIDIPLKVNGKVKR